jgi:hypothetical protein
MQKLCITYDISGYHDSESPVFGLLGYDIVSSVSGYQCSEGTYCLQIEE